MARYRRRKGYRRWRRYFKRYYRKKWYGSGSRRLINNSSRSRVSIKTRQDAVVNAEQLTTWDTSVPCAFNPWIKHYFGEQDPFKYLFPVSTYETNAFQNFSILYDEVRLTRCKVNIQVLDPLSSLGDAGLTMWTCWDRSTTVNDLDTGRFPGVADIIDSPSSKMVTCLPHTVNAIARAIYPSDLQERTQWVHTVRSQDEIYVHPYGQRTEINVAGPAAWFAEPSHHTFFCPTLYLVMDPHNRPVATRSIKLHVTMSCTYEFRSPRFGQSSGSSKLLTEGALPVEEEVVRETPPAKVRAIQASMEDDDGPTGAGLVYEAEQEAEQAGDVARVLAAGALGAAGGALYAGPVGAVAGGVLTGTGAAIRAAKRQWRREHPRDEL